MSQAIGASTVQRRKHYNVRFLGCYSGVSAAAEHAGNTAMRCYACKASPHLCAESAAAFTTQAMGGYTSFGC